MKHSDWLRLQAEGESICATRAPTGLLMPQTDSTPILEALQRGSGRLRSHLATKTRQRLDIDTQRYQLPIEQYPPLLWTEFTTCLSPMAC